MSSASTLQFPKEKRSFVLYSWYYSKTNWAFVYYIVALSDSPSRKMPLSFNPPLLNSANPWATTQSDLQTLYDCPYTGAITTRTFTLKGFNHDDAIHQYCFYDSQDHKVQHHSSSSELQTPPSGPISSLNTLGYSPFSLRDYLLTVPEVLKRSTHPGKPIIFSVTGNPQGILLIRGAIQGLSASIESQPKPRFLIEINLSCPNIAGKPPPAYDKAALLEYLHALNKAPAEGQTEPIEIEVGIKTPPYTHQTQFECLISALLSSSSQSLHRPCPISFITATNTLGNCLVLDPTTSNPALNSNNGTGIGGLAGSALHPLAMGNVATLRRMLDAHEELKDIEIIGVGGISDAAGYERMRSVGASAVAVGTALGAEGVGAFEKIWEGVECGKGVLTR